jgi:signal transduction histidine kinase
MVSELAREIRRREESEKALLEARNRLVHYASDLEQRVDERTRELSEAVKTLQELLYQIAHNLRAPLRAMEGYSRVLLEDCSRSLDSQTQECSQRIATAAKRMDHLIQDVIEYGLLSHEQVTLRPVSLNDALAQTRLQLDDKIKGSNAEISADGPFPEVIADMHLLVEVLRHLLANALTFASPGKPPHIGIWTECRTSTLRLWIEDNGPGIEPRYQERIFDLFETINPHDPIGSTGVGLAIVKRAMVRMNGRVGVESKPGSGSRFWIELPASMDR